MFNMSTRNKNGKRKMKNKTRQRCKRKINNGETNSGRQEVEIEERTGTQEKRK